MIIISLQILVICLPINNFKGVLGIFTANGRESLHDALMSAALEQNIQSPNRVYATKENLAAIAVGLPELVCISLN